MSQVRVTYDGARQQAVIDVDHGGQGYVVCVPDSRAGVGTPMLTKFHELCSLLKSDGVSAMHGELTEPIEEVIREIQRITADQTVNREASSKRFVRMLLMRGFDNSSFDVFMAGGIDSRSAEFVFSIPVAEIDANAEVKTLVAKLLVHLEKVFPCIFVGDVTEIVYSLLDQIAVLLDREDAA